MTRGEDSVPAWPDISDSDPLIVAEGSPRTARQKALLAAKVLLGLLAIALLVALALLRTWPPLDVVMTGSMEPTIKVGDVVVMGRLDRPAEVGDIVAVHPPQSIQNNLNYPSTVIHRIVEIDPGGKVYTKGDARKQRDPFTEPRDAIKTHVVATIPGVGRIVAFFTSPLGLIWVGLGLLLFVLLPYFELRRDQMELEQAEVGSLSSLRLELQEVAQRVEASRGEAAQRLLPAAAAAEPEPLPQPGAAETTSGELEEMQGTMRELVGAVGEYGEHLRSHTAVLQGMSAASQDLAATVATLRTILPTPPSVATPPAALPPQPTTPVPDPRTPLWSAAEQARYEAARLALWRERRAIEIAAEMGFHDPINAAGRAPLGDAAADEGVERALWTLAFENPRLLGS